MLRRYGRALYADVDTRYDECAAATAKCGDRDIALSRKEEEGQTVMRTNWILFCDLRGNGTKEIVRKWAGAYEDVYLQDQAVFNRVFSCGQDVTCVDNERRQDRNASDVQRIEIAHCGSYLEREQRLKCMAGG